MGLKPGTEEYRAYHRNYHHTKRKANVENFTQYIEDKVENREQYNAWYQDIKANCVCSNCGFNNPAALQFHHLDQSTKISEISTMIKNRKNKQIVLDEMNKCIVLCANCHSIETVKQRKNNAG